MSVATCNVKPYKLRINVQPVLVMELFAASLQQVEKQLVADMHQAPKMFANATMLIDMHSYNPIEKIDFTELSAMCKSHGIAVIGVTNSPESMLQELQDAGICIIPKASNNGPKDKQKPYNNKQTKTVTQSVRSGQQIYAKEQDLLVLGNVSSGAEVIADGNIYIYGTLTGRAIAGASGRTDSRIIVTDFCAQLISIAGVYQVIDTVEDCGNRAKHIYLSEGKMVMEGICQ